MFVYNHKLKHILTVEDVMTHKWEKLQGYIAHWNIEHCRCGMRMMLYVDDFDRKDDYIYNVYPSRINVTGPKCCYTEEEHLVMDVIE